jgi:anaerobic C4-dicarboxylate transporter
MIASALARLAPYKIELQLAAGMIAVASAFGVGWMVNGWRLEAALANLEATHAQEKEAQATGALKTLQADAAAIRQAATEYAGIETTLAPKIAALTKELRNAPRLPVDCKPDQYRVRNLDTAIDAANSAIPR